MDLVKCKNCGKEVSAKTNICPNCGANPRQNLPIKKRIGIWLIYINVVLMFGLIVYNFRH